MSKFHSGCRKEKITEILKNPKASIRFVGVGGIGMYSLFRLSEAIGLSVSGSDRSPSRLTDSLIAQNAKVDIGHNTDAALKSELLVYSLAVSEKDPELEACEAKGIPAVSRAEYLGALMEKYKVRIGVSGSHGKSTSTAMVDAIFNKAKKAPTTLLGALLPGKEEPVRIGGNDVIIYEACEYKDSFLHFSPTAALFTNLEMDHADYFKDIEHIRNSFRLAMDIPNLAVVNIDDVNLREIVSSSKTRTVTFGKSPAADYRAYAISSENGIYSFKIRHAGREIAKIRLSVAGEFNVSNALGAFTLAHTLGIRSEVIAEALEDFRGIERRLETVGKFRGATVYYDYAHHPTEIKCTVNAVKEMICGRVTVIFKPHTFSRTAAFMNEFAEALSLADTVLLCDIAAIREEAIAGISSEALASIIGKGARCISEENIIGELERDAADAIIIMGAADLDKIKRSILFDGDKYY